ncbi:probable G-protein coupled receptor frpr-1 [Physella acuta]|uniref:probable G-protein coupled receptor frpr-1 n=1 Tax=Physella acuta TaxID=109671 RepID=UPI0027DBF544|nr:probable G-protein coupled receptor frpr-1 [Physella acuta]
MSLLDSLSVGNISGSYIRVTRLIEFYENGTEDIAVSSTQTLIVSTFGASNLLPPRLLETFMVLNLVCSEFIGVLGIIANVVNIIVFYKLGYEDTVNIKLTALAVSDIGALVTSMFYALVVNPWFLNADLPFQAIDIMFMIGFNPHNYFIRVCGFITAFASFERCLCVLAPLKVKRIITKNVSTFIVITIFLVLLLDLFPTYYAAYLDWVFNPLTNKSILAAVFRENNKYVFDISYLITDLFLPYLTFIIIITSTVTIAATLKKQSLWRQSCNSKSDNKQITKKEKRVVMMLSVVAVVFIVCLIPQSAVLTASGLVPELGAYGLYFDVFLVVSCLSYLMETVSSSANIVIYYSMSSKYKETIHSCFYCLKLNMRF